MIPSYSTDSLRQSLLEEYLRGLDHEDSLTAM
jgi:hypothetical protein